jgi:hypothetical protein
MGDKITGWYPDPGGADRFRYWNGTAWSATTTEDPRDPPPSGPAGALPHRTRLGMIIGVLATVVIMVIGGALLVGNLRPRSDDPLPAATVGGGDDSSPSEPAQPRDEASPSGASPQPLPHCQRGDPDDRSPHPDDGRVYGGNLSFPEQRTFDPAASEPRMTFARDVTQQIKIVSRTPGWIAQLAAGQVRADDFGRVARTAAEKVAECLVTGDLYRTHSAARHDLRSAAIKIDDRNGWLIEGEIRVTEPGLKFAGDHVIIVVVRDGANWGLFFGAVPIGDERLTALLEQTVAGLQAD